MRVRAFLLVALLPALFPASAVADYPHVVAPGETLTSVAAADGLSIEAIAQANGISPEAQLVAGQILQIPPQTYATAASVTSTATYTSTAATTSTATSSTTSTATSSTADSAGDSGDTSAATQSSTSSAQGGPQPTDEFVSAGEIATIAAEYGVPAGLAEAIGWQESGWNNAEVSTIGAVGVMQIVPTTWSWIDTYLTPANPLGTASAAENVRGGVLLLHQLLQDTGGNESLAVAGYYQGLASVQKYGMYAGTQQYVADVLALAQRFGG